MHVMAGPEDSVNLVNFYEFSSGLNVSRQTMAGPGGEDISYVQGVLLQQFGGRACALHAVDVVYNVLAPKFCKQVPLVRVEDKAILFRMLLPQLWSSAKVLAGVLHRGCALK